MPLISNVWIPLVLREQSLDSLDQIEVFDSADHFILKSFEYFGLKSSLIGIMKAFRGDVQRALKINGSLSAPFTLHRGVSHSSVRGVSQRFLSRMLFK